MSTRSSKTKRTPVQVITVLLTMLIAATVLSVSGTARAQTPDEFSASRTAAASTRGFWIHNLTTKKLKLTKVENLNAFISWDNKELLPVGYVIQPGEIAHTELDADGVDGNRVRYSLDVLDFDGSVHSRITVGMYLDGLERWQAITANSPVKPGAQSVVSNGLPPEYSTRYYAASEMLDTTGLITGQDLDIYDAQGTIFDATTLTPPQQGRLIANFCESDAAHCSFTTDDDGVPARSPVTIVDDRSGNRTCKDQTLTYNQTETRTTTNSWEFSASVKAGVKEVWEAQFTAKYGGAVTEASAFLFNRTMTISPGFYGYFTSSIPVYRYTGRWLIEVRIDGAGQVVSTIEVHGTVDIPDTSVKTTNSDGQLVSPGELDGVVERMTDQERATLKDTCRE